MSRSGPAARRCSSTAIRISSPRTSTPYELGYRSRPHASISWSLSTFYNEYDDLRTIEPASGRFPAAALGQPDGRQHLRSRAVGELAGEFLVAPVAGFPDAAQTTAFQRRCFAAAGARAGRQRSELRSARSSRPWTSGAGPWTRCCVMSETCRAPRALRTTNSARAWRWRASDSLEFSDQRLQSTRRAPPRVRGSHRARDSPLRLRRGALDVSEFQLWDLAHTEIRLDRHSCASTHP